MNRKRKPPTNRTAAGKRFRRTHDKSATGSLLTLFHSANTMGKCVDEMDVAETLVTMKEIPQVSKEMSPSTSNFKNSLEEPVTVNCSTQVYTPQYRKSQCSLLLASLKIINFALFQTTIELRHMQPFSDKLLTNKKDMIRALFIQTVEDPKKSCHCTGHYKIYYSMLRV